MHPRGYTKKAIIAALTVTSPMTAEEIDNRAGLKTHLVRVSIGAMITRFGGVMQVGKSGHAILYGLPGRDEYMKTKTRRENVAGPRYIAPRMGELRRNLFEHRDLALAGR